MKKFYVTSLLLSILLSSQCFAGGLLSVDPEAVIIGEETLVRFTLKTKEKLHKAKVTVFRLDKNSKKYKVFEMGVKKQERQKRTGTSYIGKTKLRPKLAGELFFIAMIEEGNKKEYSNKIKVEIIECPQ